MRAQDHRRGPIPAINSTAYSICSIASTVFVRAPWQMDTGPVSLCSIQPRRYETTKLAESRFMRETLCLFLAFSALAGAEDFTIKTFAGGGLPQNIQGTSAVFPLVGGIVADANGNAYFVASFHTVMRLDQNGVLTVVAGNGTPGYSGDGGLATNAQLNQPATIALDGTGNLYIADYGNGRIRKVQNGIISTIAGGGTQTADNVPAVNALINALYVAADAAGNVYVEDPSPSLAVCCRIRKVANGVITTIAGNGTFGYSGDGGPATSAQLFRPGAMALDAAGTLYFFDDTTSRTSIMCGCYLRKIQNGVITTVAPTTYLNSIAIDAAGNIFIGGSALQELQMECLRRFPGHNPFLVR